MKTRFVLAALVVCRLAAPLAAGDQRPGRRWTTIERIETAHLRAVHEARQRLAAERREMPARGVFEDYRAVLHVHAEDAPHTGGTRQQVLAGAKEAGVRIVLLSDHRGPKPDTWRGIRDGVLFVPGSETGDGFLDAAFERAPLRFLCHVEERLDAPTAALDGLEIYNRHTDATDENEFVKYFQAAMKNPEEWKKIGANLAAYPDEFFGAQADYWPSIFAKWDREAQAHPLTGIAANDAHHNQVYQGLDFDPYARSFRNVSTHVLARGLTEPDVREALKQGRVYVSHDWLADPTGFAFNAVNNLGVFDAGDSVPMLGGTRLRAQTPVEAKLRLIRNGTTVQESAGRLLDFTPREPGVYRVEAWLAMDGEERAWIYSNPIYLETPGAETLRLPPSDISPEVDVQRDIAYVAGKPEDEAKHKLDVYVPKGRKNFPVYFFIHGGSWRSGDRTRYVALGNRFAKAGIGTVVISYRLAPQNRHPAQIEDVAAAFAWTVKHIGESGGRVDRIFVGGHSAGGHLAALLALDPQYLAAHGLQPRNIRGVTALSGVYEIAGLETVFGPPESQKQASPATWVKAGAPPFVVSYCQWDYASLPVQARRFDAALRGAGVPSELVYVPGESHISEIISVITKPADLTARSILKFIHDRE